MPLVTITSTPILHTGKLYDRQGDVGTDADL